MTDFQHYLGVLFWGLGLGAFTANCASLYDLKVTSLILPAEVPVASEASDETEKRDKSVVTDSWLGDLNILQATVKTGVWGGPLPADLTQGSTFVPLVADAIVQNDLYEKDFS